MSFSDPSLMRPRSSGLRKSSIVRLSSASLPTSKSRFRILRATRSAGQPTKLSTTTRSPADVEIALRDVPRSMPTVNTLLASLAPMFSGLLVSRWCALVDVGVDAVEQGVRNRLPVLSVAEQRRFFEIREAGHFGENRRHPRRREDDKRGGFDA